MSDAPVLPPSKLTLEEREQAVRQWFPLVRKLASYYMPRLQMFYEYQDLVAVGNLALWQASLTYETGHGATFGTYGFYAVRHAYEALLKRWFAKRRRGARRSDSIDALGPDDDAPKHQLRSEVASAEELLSALNEQVFLQEALLDLRPRARRVIQARFIEERCLEDIARELGLSRERIRQIEIASLRKLRKKLAFELAERPKTARPVSYAQSTGRGQRNSRLVPPGKVASPPGSS